ncbi:MAG: tRNA (guanosine(46)-N7)-methyltransferase TrmB [Pseudomonadota bacterium]
MSTEDHKPKNETARSDADGNTRLSSLPVRSFVRREGRLTRAQQRALDDLWPQFGIEYTGQPLELDALFARSANTVIEIGFGNGESLAQCAQDAPDTNYIGIEVHRPGVGHLLLEIEQRGLTNVRVMCHDAVEVLTNQLAPGSLAGLNLFFPDPWPKKRHHKRRIVQQPFLGLVASRMKAGARLHVATDWENYAEHIFDTLEASPHFSNTAGGADFNSASVPRPEFRPPTKFERRGERLGHSVWDFIYEKTS